MIEIYTDGSCCGNGKAENNGGWGVVVNHTDFPGQIFNPTSARIVNTTNNRMEMEALLYALGLSQSYYKDETVTIYSDSAYCVNMFNDWILKWARNGWRRTGNKDIENLDLVKKIYEYAKLEWSNFTVEKIKGHANNIYNEIADALATDNQTKFAKILKENNIIIAEEENI